MMAAVPGVVRFDSENRRGCSINLKVDFAFLVYYFLASLLF